MWNRQLVQSSLVFHSADIALASCAYQPPSNSWGNSPIILTVLASIGKPFRNNVSSYELWALKIISFYQIHLVFLQTVEYDFLGSVFLWPHPARQGIVWWAEASCQTRHFMGHLQLTLSTLVCSLASNPAALIEFQLLAVSESPKNCIGLYCIGLDWIAADPRKSKQDSWKTSDKLWAHPFFVTITNL